jgi:hypothetical protein
MKRREKLGSADQTSRSDDHQIYCGTEELDAELILRKLNRIWGKSFFDELTTNSHPLLGFWRSQYPSIHPSTSLFHALLLHLQLHRYARFFTLWLLPTRCITRIVMGA